MKMSDSEWNQYLGLFAYSKHISWVLDIYKNKKTKTGNYNLVF